MITREEWNSLTDDEKWEMFNNFLEVADEKTEPEFTPHSFLKSELEAASEAAELRRKEATESTRLFWEQYEREQKEKLNNAD